MKFLLDENFPRAAINLLNRLGHVALDIRGTDREGISDSALFEYAQQESAILLTTDRDFFHTVPHIYSIHFGVVVIALRQPNRANILARLDWLLAQESLFPLDGTVVQMRDQTYVIRRPRGYSGD